MLSEVFLSFAVSSFIGCVLGIVTFCYRSKCRECSFLGIKIVRDVQIELQEDMSKTRFPLENTEVKNNN
jgi:hypothetical protein